MAYAIKRIRKVYASPFSPQVKQARLRQRFYNLHLSIHVNKLDLHRQLQTLELELDQVLPVPANIEEAKQLLRDAQKNVQKSTTKAAAQRLTHHECCAASSRAEATYPSFPWKPERHRSRSDHRR